MPVSYIQQQGSEWINILYPSGDNQAGFGKVPGPSSFQLLAVLGTQVPICVPFFKTVALAAAVKEASSRVVARGTIRIIYIGHGV
jgi:hypothetical protein